MAKILSMGTWFRPKVEYSKSDAEFCRKYRYLSIEGTDDSASAQARWWPALASQFGAWFASKVRPLPRNSYRLQLSRTRTATGFLTINYVESGKGTSLRTMLAAARIVEHVAVINECYAIVCHTANPRLSDRVLNFMGYERHCRHLPGRHYIRRLSSRSCEDQVRENREVTQFTLPFEPVDLIHEINGMLSDVKRENLDDSRTRTISQFARKD